MSRAWLFIVACMLSGLSALLGSIVGNLGGKTWLMIGGVVGGLIGAAASAYVARGRGWIPAELTPRVAVGACIGFLAAAGVATNTLGSPVGPVLSTLLIGVGALAGASRRHA